jgi:Sec-independent protein translocase protein TatA
MQTLEALRILKTRLETIDQEHDAEFAVDESEREALDAKAEALALSAIFDFLKECKITLPDSLLRIFRRYLGTAKQEISSHKARTKKPSLSRESNTS